MLPALKKKLAAAQKAFAKAKTPSATGMVNENVEDGNYDAQLVKCELVVQADKPACVFSFQLEDGEVVKNRCWLHEEQALGYFKRDLARFGVDEPDSVDLGEDLESLLDQIVANNPQCRITVKTNGEFQNVYLNKVTDMGGETEDGEEEEAEEEATEEATIEVGSTVVYKGAEAEVVAIADDGETCTVKTAKSKVKGVKVASLELVVEEAEEEAEEEEAEEEAVEEEEEEEASIEVGSTVTYQGKNCEVTAIDPKTNTLTLKTPKGVKYSKVPAAKVELVHADETEEEGEEELAELVVGAKVSVNYQGKDQPGKVTAIDEDAEKVTVLLTNLKKKVTVDVDKIELEQ